MVSKVSPNPRRGRRRQEAVVVVPPPFPCFLARAQQPYYVVPRALRRACTSWARWTWLGVAIGAVQQVERSLEGEEAARPHRDAFFCLLLTQAPPFTQTTGTHPKRSSLAWHILLEGLPVPGAASGCGGCSCPRLLFFSFFWRAVCWDKRTDVWTRAAASVCGCRPIRRVCQQWLGSGRGQGACVFLLALLREAGGCAWRWLPECAVATGATVDFTFVHLPIAST